MAEVKVSALTALTGANVANGDELYIVDTGSPNVSKKITADELAQMPQLSSRYMPLDKLWLPAGQFDILAGSPATGTLGNATLSTNRQPVWLLDQSTVETVGTSVLQPANWATFDVYVWWSNAGAGAGDVVWQYNLATFANAETTDSNVPSGHSGTLTAPLQYVAQRDKLSTSARNASPGEILKVAISRVASVAGDTLANDCGLIGVELVRVS